MARQRKKKSTPIAASKPFPIPSPACKAISAQQTVNRTLETNLATTTTEYSNKLVSRDAQLATTQADLTKAEADAKAQAAAAAAAVAERDKKIADLETQNQELDKESADLHISITNLEDQIGMTKRKLASSKAIAPP